ncbi:MAG: undecaprenyl-diphosphate phosphatase [Pararhizobium sp.]
MSVLQAIILAAIQGVTELFPVSSLGHAVILPRLFGWSVDQHSPSFLPFLVMLHLGTAVALLAYFWRDWIGILFAVLGIGGPETVAAGRKLFVRIVVGTIPAVILGFALEKPLRALFGSPAIVAGVLAVNGIVLLVAERLRHRATSKQRLRDISLGKALFIGACQAGALIPGLSRSGLTMGAGLGVGLDHAQSARFSFLLAAPIITGAAVLEVPKLLHESAAGEISLGLSVVGGIVAGITAFASVAFLMRFFRKHEFEALDPFAYYCLVAGILACLALSFGLA